MIHIVGAGPGSPDLITVRGRKLLGKTDVVIYAGSLVNPELLGITRKGTLIYDGARMTLEEVIGIVEQSWKAGLCVVRLHAGDPCIYGVIREQMDWMDEKGIAYDICLGVSSFCGAAAALGMEYTLPDMTQSVVITRITGRTLVPEQGSTRSFVSHGAAMVMFLGTGVVKELSRELMGGRYKADTPATIVYEATWPEEEVVHYTVGTLKEAAGKKHIIKTTLIVVEDSVVQKGYERSKLYDPGFTTVYREGKRASDTMYVVGMGPGGVGQVTEEALETLRRCQVIAGYTVYADLVREHFPQKEFLTTAMTRKEERYRKALECCMEGKNTAMMCSGDTGVYDMAGLILELSKEYPGIEVKIVPEVTATCTRRAVLRTPLVHNFAVVSLSDRLTPLDTIWDRIESAARADFIMCTYNLASKGRPDYFGQACQRILKYRSGDTVCGPMANIGREGQSVEVLSLEEAKDRQVDMFTTMYIGNSYTRQIGPYMATPRGYRHEEK